MISRTVAGEFATCSQVRDNVFAISLNNHLFAVAARSLTLAIYWG